MSAVVRGGATNDGRTSASPLGRSRFLDFRRRRRWLRGRFLLLLALYAGFHERNADRLSALLDQCVAISLPPSALNARDHGRTRSLFAGVDNLFMGRGRSRANEVEKDGRASQTGRRPNPTFAHAFVPAFVGAPQTSL